MRYGHLKSFVLVGGVGVLALAAVGVNAATSLVTIQVTNEPTLQQDPAVKGGLVAYTEYDGLGSGDVWVYDLDDGTRIRAVTNGASQSLEDLDAHYVVYSDDRNSPELDIYALDLSSTPPTPTLEHAVVIAPGYQTEPAISGNRVVWEHSDPIASPGNVDIYVGCVTGCSNIQLTSHPAVQFRPAVSGDLVVWEDARVDGTPDIFGYWFIDPPGPGVAGENPIAIGGPRARNPDVSGTRVVWDQQTTGLDQKDIFLYDFATGVTTQITTDPANQVRPRISGNLIVWEDSRNATTDLYGYDLDTNTEIAFVSTSLPEHLQDVDVRADGGWDIAYTVDQGGGNSDIFVLRATIIEETPTPTATATMTATPTPTPTPTSGDPCDPDSGAPEYFSETFERGTGAPVREERHFSAAAGPGTICLTLEHVSSAWVDVNGDEIFGPSDFNPNATSARADITLLESNELGVKLAGAPCDGEACEDDDDQGDHRWSWDDHKRGDHRRFGHHKPGHDDSDDNDDGDSDDHGDRDDDDGGDCDDGDSCPGGGDDDDDGDHDDDGDDGHCARMTVRVVGPVPPPLSGLAAGVEGATQTEAVPGAENGSGHGSGAACSVSSVATGSPLAGLLLLGGLVLATRRRRQQ